MSLINIIYTQNDIRTDKYEFSFNQKELRQVLYEIGKQTGINFIYKDDLVNNSKVSGHFTYKDKENLIKNILGNYDIGYKIYGKNDYVLFRKTQLKTVVKKEQVDEKEEVNITDTIHTVTVPKLISEADPYYPPEALQKNIEGEVTIRMFVNRNGKVTSVSVEKSSGSPVLDSAALAYSNNLEFIPAHANGHPLNTWSLMVFKYHILGE